MPSLLTPADPPRKRHPCFKDLTGQRFNRWTVLGLTTEPQPAHGHSQRHSRWHCRCDCGKEKLAVHGITLTKGTSKSCGCLRNERNKEWRKES